MLPREAVPVGSGQAGCWLEVLRLCYQGADPPLHTPSIHPPPTHTQYTHTHVCAHRGESCICHGSTAVTQLSHSCHGARAEPEDHLRRLGTADLAELQQRAALRCVEGTKEKSNYIFISSRAKKKKKRVMVFFGIILVVEQMHFTYLKYSDLLVELHRRQKP